MEKGFRSKVIAPLAAVLAMSACSKSHDIDAIRSKTMYCLDGQVPAVDSKVCDPTEAEKLVKIAREKCFANVEGLTPADVGQGITRALNEQCRIVRKEVKRVRVDQVNGGFFDKAEFDGGR